MNFANEMKMIREGMRYEDKILEKGKKKIMRRAKKAARAGRNECETQIFCKHISIETALRLGHSLCGWANNEWFNEAETYASADLFRGTFVSVKVRW